MEKTNNLQTIKGIILSNKYRAAAVISVILYFLVHSSGLGGSNIDAVVSVVMIWTILGDILSNTEISIHKTSKDNVQHSYRADSLYVIDDKAAKILKIDKKK